MEKTGTQKNTAEGQKIRETRGNKDFDEEVDLSKRSKLDQVYLV